MGIFGGIKWAAIGDSLTANMASSRGNYEFVIADATDIQMTMLAVSGTGWIDEKEDNNHFGSRVSQIPTDADIVTVFGSINDVSICNSELWASWDVVGYSKNCVVSSTPGQYSHYIHLYNATNPQRDTIEDKTMAGVINDTIHSIHMRAPNAKVIVIPGLYGLQSRQWYSGPRAGHIYYPHHLNSYRLLKLCVDGWLADNKEDCVNWLSWRSMFYDGDVSVPSSDRSLTNCIFVEDNTQLDMRDTFVWNGVTYANPNKGKNFDYRKTNPNFNADADEPKAFSRAYNSDWHRSVDDAVTVTGGIYNAPHSPIHPNADYNRYYLAPKFASWICEALGIDPAGLPESLKLNNLNPPTTYTATFFAEGFGIVDTVEFEAGATVLPRVPTVPYKEGYTGAWEPYTLADANITINARYTPIQPDAIAYDINGDEIYNAYDINGAPIAKLYDINGESLV